MYIIIVIIIIIIIITTTIFMVLSSWRSAIVRIHQVHMMNADSAPYVTRARYS